MGNGGSVDKLLWRGDSNASLVQRIGMVIFGGFWLCLAAATLFLLPREKDSWVSDLFSLPVLFVGAKIFLNAFKRHKHPVDRK